MKSKISGSVFWIAVLIIMSFSVTTFIAINSVGSALNSEKEDNMKLVSSSVYNAIDSQTSANIAIVRTMAKNNAVVELLFEDSSVWEGNREAIIKQNLMKLQVGMGIDFSFVASQYTENFYTANGFLRKLDSSVDFWYSECANNGKDYTVQIRNNAQDHKNKAMYCSSIRDGNNNLLGVCGISVDISSLQTVLQNMESEYGLKAYLVDDNGNVAIAADNSKIGSLISADYKSSTDAGKYRYENNADFNGSKKSFISRYSDKLGLYLIVVDDRIFSFSMLTSAIIKCIVSMMIVLLLVVVFFKRLRISGIRKNDDRKVDNKEDEKLSDGDAKAEVTEQPKRKLNEKIVDDAGALDANVYKALAIVDMDVVSEDGKADEANLRKVAQILKKLIKDKAVFFRWGDKSFVVPFKIEAREAAQVCEEIRLQVAKETKNTVSVGVTGVKAGDTLESAAERADVGVYKANAAGNNKVFLVK